jgi:large subunit ribosomal protein L35
MLFLPGDMNRPIYRFLADREWRSQRRLLIMQRMTQMHIVPDILPHFDPVAEVKLAFGRRNVRPGDFVDSRVSEIPARLRVQVFDQGERLISIVVVDPDIPNEGKDSFDYRCHFLALNIPISPCSTSVPLSQLGPQTVLGWLPPTAQKGAPYHRFAVFVLQHRDHQALDLDAVRQNARRERFNLRSFKHRYGLTPVGAHLFRSQWDEGTAGVMARAGLPGAEVEWHRKKTEKLPYQKKDGARYR